MIEFLNVTKTYPNQVKANIDIPFNVNKGDIIGLVGPNGSGKTTLIRQLIKTIKTTKGEILVDSEKEKYMKKIAFVPQYPALYPSLTVSESIFYALRYASFPKTRRKTKNR